MLAVSRTTGIGCAGTGKEQMVRVHHDKGVAIHIGPESCAGGREIGREAAAIGPSIAKLAPAGSRCRNGSPGQDRSG
jgi:hypothetical protein